MPEIAEVETIKRDLLDSKKVLGQKIKNIQIFFPKILFNISKEEFCKKIKNSTIKNISRNGKYLILQLDNFYLLIHLKMTGHIFLKDQNYKIQKHDHISITLDNKKKIIYFDPRKFGNFQLKKDLSFFNKLGPDILSKNFTFDFFFEKLKSKQKNIKNYLLDQSFIAGLGNIYVNEVLFLAKIHPLKICNTLNKSLAKNLYEITKKVIIDAIYNRGTSLGSSKSNFSSINEDFGKNQNFLMIHTKAFCPECLNKVQKIKVSQRTSHVCLKCQKL